jgi:hypothetical protein
MSAQLPIDVELRVRSRLNSPNLAAQGAATAQKSHVTPYSARFYPQVHSIQDFSRKEGAVSRKTMKTSILQFDRKKKDRPKGLPNNFPRTEN